MTHWAELKRLSYVTDPARFNEIAQKLGYLGSAGNSPETFRVAYRTALCDPQGWPRAFKIVDEKRVEQGLKVFSLSRKIEGRTTGSRTKCRATGCPSWSIGVLWETGQQMFICSEGWHFDNTNNAIHIIGGGEISARFVSPKPLGVDPAPRKDWPKRSDLTRRFGWRST